MSEQKRIAVVGSGSWGTALANVLADAGHQVTLWGRDRNLLNAIATRHENEKYLKGVSLSKALRTSPDLEKTLQDASIVLCAIPTQQIRSVFSGHAKALSDKGILNASKGIELKTQARVSQIFQEVAPRSRYAVLSGPSFAIEVGMRLPAAVTIASRDTEFASLVQHLVHTPYFRAYTSKDIVGVEFAGALKNVVAIAAGMVSGLKLGYNAQAALINRGIAEIMRMSRKEGADAMTFLGLAGTGDLILTCTGPLSRNRTVGTLLGEGKQLADIQRDLGGVAEGVFTAKSAYELSKRYQIEMPITEQVYKILYEGSTPQKALLELMSRDLKEEW